LVNKESYPKKVCFLTNDVETTSIVKNRLSTRTGGKVLKEGMPLLLSIYEKYNIKTTFFFNCDIVRKFPEVVRMVIPLGHEVASHGLTHEMDKAFDVLNLKQQIEHLDKSKKMLEDITGSQVISFRAPALRVNEYTVQALHKTGFLIDSSIASQRFDMFMSLGTIKKFNRLTAPRLPYRTSNKNLALQGNSSIIEIPISAFILPYIGTTLRMFPRMASFLGKLLDIENKVNNKPINFLIHPNEFIEEKIEKKEYIYNKNINFILTNIIRNKLKLKNLGKAAVPLYEKEIEYFKNKGYSFLPLNKYLRRKTHQ